MALPYPTNQLVFNGGSQDVGTSNSLVTVTTTSGVVSYINYDGKDCVYINSTGQTPSISIPYVVSETSSFTLSFWITDPAPGYWKMSMGIDNGVSSIIEYSIHSGFFIMTYGPTLNNSEMVEFLQSGWSHIVVTYSNNVYTLYKNGVLLSTTTFNTTFTSTRINIGGNNPYANWRFGGENGGCRANIRQLCTFDSVLTLEQVAELYTQTQGNTTLIPQINPLIPSQLTISSVSTNSFTVSWSGGTDATSYSYTLNGSPATPSTDNGLYNNSAIFTDLTENTSYSLVVIATNSSESQESPSKSLTTLLNPPTSVTLSTDTITLESFTANWTGGVGATSYSYMLNGSSATPSSETSQSAIFTGLILNTSYSLIVTAINAGGQTSSTSVSTTTLDLPKLNPINQFIFNGVSEDLGTQPVDAIVSNQPGVVSYINYAEKECVYINSDSENTSISIPYVVSETSSFTISFWLNAPYTDFWNLPFGLDDGELNIINYVVFLGSHSYMNYGSNINNVRQVNLTINGWTNIVISYSNSVYTIYQNGVVVSSDTLNRTFTSTKINIGGNNNYIGWFFGEQISCVAYIRQVCTFDYVLNIEQINQLYTQTQDNTILSLPSDPLIPYKLNISSITQTSFTASWLGGADAISYTYTLNGSPATPSIDSGVSNKSATFTDLTPNTGYSLVVIATNASGSQSSRSKSLSTLPNPPTQMSVSTDTITFESFTATWTGGVGATSYLYTLNESPITPSSETSQSAIFTGLTPLTTYSLVVIAVNLGGQTSSTSVSITTLMIPPLSPINQLVLSESSEDLGTNYTTPLTLGNVSYITYAGKNCLNFVRSSIGIPSISVPSVFTETSSFTISFWLYMDSNMSSWYCPIGLDDGTLSIITFGFLYSSIFVYLGSATVGYTQFGTGPNYNGYSTNTNTQSWNNIALTYTNGTYSLYTNGVFMTSLDFAQSFTSTQITIGENSLYNSWAFAPFSENKYIRQVCVFDSALTAEQMNQLYTETQENAILAAPLNQLIPYRLSISSITTTSFVVSWYGSVDATSYTYTLNGTSVIPSINNGVSNKSATFTGLTPNTSYSIVITGVSASESQSSRSKNVETFMQLPSPTNQLVLNVSNDDLGSNPTVPITTGSVSYINYAGKDCMSVSSFGLPGLSISYTTIPCVFTEASSFTISFWSYMHDTMTNWYCPIGLDDGTKSSIMVGLMNQSIYIFVGAPPGNYTTLGGGSQYNGVFSNINIESWNNFTITYTGGTYVLYVNGIFVASTLLTHSFTSTEITIGDTNKYTTWNLGTTQGTMYIRQLCIFNSALIDTQITQLYTQTQNNSLLLPISNLLTVYNLITSNIDFTTFAVSWSGGTGATSYRYTLNGSLVTPSINNGLVSQSATFTGLSPNTRYSLVVTAVSASESKASVPFSVATRIPLPAPTNQFVFNGATTDVGSSSVPVVLTDPTGIIEYTNYSGKDCIHINSDGSSPKLSIPYVATETSSFTLSYWANMANDGYLWEILLALGDEQNTILFSAINQPSVYIKCGDSLVSGATGITSDWNHIVITYSNKISSVYVNGELRFMLPLTNKFTSTEINICGNSSYGLTQLGPTLCDAYIRQLCIFDSSLNNDQVAQLYAQTQENTVFTIKSNTSVPYGMVVSNIDYTTFTVSWVGGTGATSYSYTLNGSSVIPSIDTGLSNKSATFTGLIANTSYSLVVIAGSNSSAPVSIRTRIPLPLPINQLVFNGFSQDVGVEYAPLTLTDPNSIIEYTTKDGIDCIHVNSDGYEPRLNIPCVATETSSFTFGFWIKFDIVGSWCVPITMNGNNIYITLAFDRWSMYFSVGSVGNGAYYQTNTMIGTDFTQWTHIIVSYKNGGLKIYKNGIDNNYIHFTQEFNTSQITIGGNNKFQESLGGQLAWDGYLHQLCVFDSALNADQANQLYLQTQGNTILAPPLDPLTPYRLNISSITSTSFIVSWSGGSGASSYIYTLNGSPSTPSTDTGVSSKSATFTGLAPNTSYSVIATAISPSNSKSSRPKSVITSTPLTIPINQFIFNGVSQDVGTANVSVALTDPTNLVSYTNNSGKDCIHMNSDGTDPTLNIPYVATETSSFTLGFWIKFDTVGGWCVPITVNGNNINFTLGFDTASMYISVGNGLAEIYTQTNTMVGSDFLNWTHVALTYKNGSVKMYKNGVYEKTVNFTQSFTTSQITIGGNNKYQYGLGGQVEWDGYLHQLCVFDSALNASQINQLYVNTQDDTVLNTRLPSLEDVTDLKNTFNTTTTIGGATESIDAAIASNVTPVVILAAALATASPTMFTALVTNPAFIGSTVSIPSNIATVLYASFADTSTLNTLLPLKVNFPAVDGKVNPPIAGSNSKLAIDLTVDTYVPFRGCTGYGIYVKDGEQYFTTPSNPIGTLVHVGDILTFTVDGGGTIVSKVADLDIVLIPYTAPQVICFLGSAPVLTPNGYSRIDSLKVGDIVCTPASIEGQEGQAIIEKIHKQVYMPDRNTNPYVIPEGRFGSHARLLISPRHKVAVAGEMIEARDLGLEQEEQYEKITYYNLQITNCENMIVAGLEVESLQVMTRMNIPIETFNYIITNKYGGILSDEMKEKCHLMADGTISVPMLA